MCVYRACMQECVGAGVSNSNSDFSHTKTDGRLRSGLSTDQTNRAPDDVSKIWSTRHVQVDPRYLERLGNSKNTAKQSLKL